MTNAFRRFSACAVVLFLLACPLAAQEFSGNINGRVVDSSEAVLPGVQITLSSPAIQGEHATISVESGSYLFRLLPPGTYSIVYIFPGFRTVVREGVIVEVGMTVTLNIDLELAALAESITVVGETPVVDIQNADLGVNFTERLLDSMPNSRDIWVILAATPGILTSRFDVGGSTMGSQTGYRTYGLDGQNNINVDGINTTFRQGSAGLYFDYGAFSEINVAAAGNNAEVAAPGVLVNTVIKTGGNDLRGQAYVDWEDDSFQGDNLTEDLQDRGVLVGDKFVRYNDFNANAGGPLIRDKLWWFGSVRNQYSAQQTQLLQNDGTPGGIFTTRLQNYTVKFNHQITPNHSLVFTAQAQRKYQPFNRGSGPSAKDYILDSTARQDGWAWAYKVQWLAVLGPQSTLEISANTNGVSFSNRSHISQTPTLDIFTGARRGGWPTPIRDQTRRWHWNANWSYFTGDHDVKIGYAFQWEDNRVTRNPAPASPGTIGAVWLFSRGGTPDFFLTTTTPFKSHNSLYNNYFFAQDKWQLNSRLTLNIGLRFDRYANFSPEQGNPGTGPFSTEITYPKTDYSTFNDLAPRVSLVYDVLGDTQTALKVSYGRFSDITSYRVAFLGNPNSLPLTTQYTWDGTLPITQELIANSNIERITGTPNPAEVDPSLENQFTDEYTIGIEHELFPDFAVNANFVRKIQHNLWGVVDQAHPTLTYRPVQAVDRGPDGLVGSGDDTLVTIYERTRSPRPAENLVTNLDRGGHFSTIEFGARKRMSDGWMMITGVDWTKRNDAFDLGPDPNTLVHGGNRHINLWSFKLLGQYELPKGVSISGTYNAQKGGEHGRRVRFTPDLLRREADDPRCRTVTDGVCTRARGLAQGSQIITMETLGTYHLPSHHLTNIRFEKTFSIGDRQSVQTMFDLFNVFNANTVLGVETFSNLVQDRNGNTVPRFARATQILNPRIFRLGLRYEW